MHHTYDACMRAETVVNVVGAFVQAVSDAVGESVAEDLDESWSSVAALVHLCKYPDETIDALRKPLALSHPGCVRLVDRLEERGLIARGDGRDRRTRSLRATPGGRAAARKVLRKRRLALERLLAKLSASERQRLGELTGKVLAGLVRDESQALSICRVCDYDVCPDAACPVARGLSEASRHPQHPSSRGLRAAGGRGAGPRRDGRAPRDF